MHNAEVAGMISGMEKVAISDKLRLITTAKRIGQGFRSMLGTYDHFQHAAGKLERNMSLNQQPQRNWEDGTKPTTFNQGKRMWSGEGYPASTGMSIGAKAGIGAGVVGAGLLARHIYKKRKARKEQQKMAASRDLNDRDLLATHQAIGAGIGLVYHAHDRYDRSTQKPGESDKRFRYRRIRNTIAGGASGSVVGAGLGTITGTAHRRARQK